MIHRSCTINEYKTQKVECVSVHLFVIFPMIRLKTINLYDCIQLFCAFLLDCPQAIFSSGRGGAQLKEPLPFSTSGASEHQLRGARMSRGTRRGRAGRSVDQGASRPPRTEVTSTPHTRSGFSIPPLLPGEVGHSRARRGAAQTRPPGVQGTAPKATPEGTCRACCCP